MSLLGRTRARVNSSNPSSTKRRINFIEGSGISIVVGDDPTNDELDVTVSGSGGAAGASFATPSIVLGSAAAMGASPDVIRSDATIVAFDATVPVTQAYSDAAAVGTAPYAARRDHRHGMPAAGTPSFATPSIVLGTAAAAGAASTVIRSDATIVAFDATAPVTQNYGDSAATGSAAVAARRDHVHGMPGASSSHTHDDSGTRSTVLGGVAEAGATVPTASATQSIAIGDYANASADGATAIGAGSGTSDRAYATGVGAVALGGNPTGGSSVAGARAGGTASIAIGRGARADDIGTGSPRSIAIGDQAKADSSETDGGATAVGGSAVATWRRAVALGTQANAHADDGATALGHNSNAGHAHATALGKDATTTATDQIAIGGCHIEFLEISDPAAGATNSARLYAKDNGSGKTQLVVRFPTGAVQVLATEP